MQKTTIYISFSQEDNTFIPVLQKGWVDYFKEYLKYTLALQQETEIVFIEHLTLEAYTQEVTEADFLICIFILSSSSLKNEAWLEESKVLINHLHLTPENKQVYSYALLKEPIIDENTYSHFTHLPSFIFYKNIPPTPSHITSKEEFEEVHQLDTNFLIFKVLNLANQLKKHVLSNKYLKLNDAIYLAQVGMDLMPARLILERELTKHGYKIFPAAAYEVEQADLKETIIKNLKKAYLSIHLFGKYSFPMPLNNSTSLEKIENKLASQLISQPESDSQLQERIIWMPENLIPDEENQKKFIENIYKNDYLQAGADIISCSLEELKDIVFEKLKKITPQEFSNKTLENESQNIIYLIYNETNFAKALELKNVLEQKGETICMLNLNDTQQELTILNQSFLLEANALIFLHTDTHLRWLRSKISDIIKVESFMPTKKYAYKIIVSEQLEQLPQEVLFQGMQLVKFEVVFQKERVED